MPASQTLSVPPDSPRWELTDQADVTNYLGRRCIHLNGGATLKDFEMRDGVTEVDVAIPARRGFFGITHLVPADDVRVAKQLGALFDREFLAQDLPKLSPEAETASEIVSEAV